MVLLLFEFVTNKKKIKNVTKVKKIRAGKNVHQNNTLTFLTFTKLSTKLFTFNTELSHFYYSFFLFDKITDDKL